MTTRNSNTSTLPLADAPQTESGTKPSLPPTQRHTHRKYPVYLSLMTALLLFSLGASIYALYTEQLLRQQQFTLNQNTDSQLQTQNQHTNDTIDKLRQEMSTLQTTIQQQTAQTDHWLLLKARYYLELAAMNALWSDNLETSTALLQQADLLLTKVPSQRTFDIRQAIAKEIAQNAQYAALDIPGLLSQLDALQQTVTTLPFKKSVVLADNAKQAPLPNTAPNTWRAHLHTSLLQLEKLVVIRHHDEALQPLLTPAYEAMLRENIRLNLQTAQWSLLQRQHAVYQIALQQAIENISRGFDTTLPNTHTLLKQLDTLMHVSWVQKKPSLNTSLTLLNQYIAAKAPPSAKEMPIQENTPRKPSEAGEPS